MKHLLRFILFVFVAITGMQLQAQTGLPTFWDCTPGTIPIGWATNITGYYTSSSYYHSAPNAIKFDATGIYLTINFVDEPDTLIYYLRGASFVGGTFTIQQSVNGTAWNTVRTFTDANIPNTSIANAAPFKDLLLANSRYARFYYSAKSSGNVCIDDITVKKRPPGPDANMKVRLNNNLIPNTTTAVIGNAASSVFRVINSGLDSTLRITAANFSGLDAAMFSVTNIPLNVPPNDSATFTLNFVGSGADGTKIAAMSLVNNDVDNNPYDVNLWAVKGCCATEPTSPAINLNFSDIKSYKFRVDFADGGSVPDTYIVLKKDSPITEEPLDGQTYLKGDYIGGAQVCYVGAAGYFYPSNVVANMHYYLKVFAANGYNGYQNYLTSSVASRDTTTLVNMIGTYYDGINILSPTLWLDLHNLVNVHTTLYYSDYDLYVINSFESRDTVVSGQSRKVLTCAYSGEKYVYNEPFAFTVYSREHVFCESWMPTYNYGNYTSLPEYADYHNLMPVNQNKINVYRSNLPLGKVVTVQYQYLLGKKGLDSLNHVVFEPRDGVKGDCARAMFYQVLCYDGVSGNAWFVPDTIDASILYGQDIHLLKKWNTQDPPDNWEIARNDDIYAVQLNRNLFIDHPEWVNLFNFDSNSSLTVNTSFATAPIQVFPNPSKGTLNLITKPMRNVRFELFNSLGVKVYSLPLTDNKTQTTLHLPHLSPGIYVYKLLAEDVVIQTSKLMLMPE